jgi:AraC family transcriptional regulator, transcriptional activator of pobA
VPERRVSRLDLDRLDGGAMQVVPLVAARFGGVSPRAPHRHDYHELIWLRDGRGQHSIDGATVPVRPHTVTVIGRGQVHVFERGEDLHGAVVRFREEGLVDAGARRGTPEWLLAGQGGRTVVVPPGEAPHLDALVAALGAELQRPPDEHSPELQRHLLSTILLWVERWYDAVRTERRAADDAEVQLHRRFARRLEEDFARHHDAAHYADALGVPTAALSRALAHVTGRATKDLITERVMLEAARLLRFTDLSVSEVAHRAGFTDPLYFSRAFKRRHDASPQAYRERARGKSMDA